jgi:hypothetical protein
MVLYRNDSAVRGGKPLERDRVVQKASEPAIASHNFASPIAGSSAVSVNVAVSSKRRDDLSNDTQVEGSLLQATQRFLHHR